MTKKILLVEDDVHMQSLLMTLFERHSLDADAVFDGEEALSLWGQGEYSLVVTDVFLPDMNAAELITSLRGLRDGFSVFVITGGDRAGTGDVHVMDQLEAMEVSGLFNKPFDHSLLIDAIRSVG